MGFGGAGLVGTTASADVAGAGAAGAAATAVDSSGIWERELIKVLELHRLLSDWQTF